MKDRMLVTPLLLLQVAWEKDWWPLAKALAFVSAVCYCLVLLFTLIDTAWGL